MPLFPSAIKWLSHQLVNSLELCDLQETRQIFGNLTSSRATTCGSSFMSFSVNHRSMSTAFDGSTENKVRATPRVFVDTHRYFQFLSHAVACFWRPWRQFAVRCNARIRVECVVVFQIGFVVNNPFIYSNRDV